MGWLQSLPSPLHGVASWGTACWDLHPRPVEHPRSEALAVRWSDLDWEHGSVRVERSLTETQRGELVLGPTKSVNGQRTVPLPRQVAAALRGLRAQRPETVYLAESLTPGVPTRPSQAARRVRKVLGSHGIGGGFHALRHGVSHVLAERGVAPETRARLLGHTPEVNAAVYGAARAEQVRAAGAGLAKVLGLDAA